MSSAVKCLIVLAIVALLFITELIPLAITAMGGAIACGLLGFIPAQQVFSGLSDSTVVLFAGMFVVGAALFHTGLAQKIPAHHSFRTIKKRKYQLVLPLQRRRTLCAISLGSSYLTGKTDIHEFCFLESTSNEPPASRENNCNKTTSNNFCSHTSHTFFPS